MEASKNQLQMRIRPATNYLSRNLLLIFAGLFFTWLLFSLPQVFNIWWPQQFWASLSNRWYALLVLLLFALYLTTLLDFFNPRYTVRTWWARPAWWINHWLQLATQYCSTRLSRHFYYLLAGLLALLAALIVVIYPYNHSTPYLLFGSFMRVAACWLLIISLWFALALKFTPTPALSSSPTRSQLELDHAAAKLSPGCKLWQACGQVLSWLAVMGLLVEAFWWAAAKTYLPGASYRLYTVSAVIHLAVLGVVIASLIDLIHNEISSSARWVALVVAVALLIFSSGSREVFDGDVTSQLISSNSSLPVTQTRQNQPSSNNKLNSDPAPVAKNWLQALDRRIDSIADGPIVILAASGGGSRAALFTALVLQMLSVEPFPTELQSPATLARPKGQHSNQPQNTSTWAERIAIISSVSGGSLAAARYAYSEHSADSAVEKLRYTSSTLLQELTCAELKTLDTKVSTASPPACCAPNLTAAEQSACDIKMLLSAFESTTHESLQCGDQNIVIETVNRAFSSQLADEMSMDFMAPMLRGFVTPVASRGDGLYHFWEHQFDWHHVDQSSALQRADDTPLLLINSTNADTGQRVIAGFPVLPKGGLLGADRGSPLALDVRNPRAANYSPTALSDYSQETINLSLTRAVRMSSNFPFGFSVNTLSASSNPSLVYAVNTQATDASQDPKLTNIAPNRPLRLLDGGVVDNTGMDSLHSVFKSLTLHATRYPLGPEAQLLNKIRAHGVIIIEIDSGAKPTRYAGGLAARLLTLPLNSLSNAGYTNALRSSDQYLTELANTLVYPADARHAVQFLGNSEKEVHGPRGIKLRRQQLAAALPVLLPTRYYPTRPPNVGYFRFAANELDQSHDAVMTAFALGPQDKAVVVATFLRETLRWRRQLSATSQAYIESNTPTQQNWSAARQSYVQALLQIAKNEMALLEPRFAKLQTLPSSPEQVAQLQAQLKRRFAQNQTIDIEPQALKQHLTTQLITRTLIPLLAAREVADAKLQKILNKVLSEENWTDERLLMPSRDQPSTPSLTLPAAVTDPLEKAITSTSRESAPANDQTQIDLQQRLKQSQWQETLRNQSTAEYLKK